MDTENLDIWDVSEAKKPFWKDSDYIEMAAAVTMMIGGLVGTGILNHVSQKSTQADPKSVYTTPDSKEQPEKTEANLP